jgi:hypothetical protein
MASATVPSLALASVSPSRENSTALTADAWPFRVQTVRGDCANAVAMMGKTPTVHARERKCVMELAPPREPKQSCPVDEAIRTLRPAVVELRR